MQLVGALFRVGMGRLASTLAPARVAPTTKEAFLAAIERAVWALPDESLMGADADDALQRPEIVELLEAALTSALAQQPPS